MEGATWDSLPLESQGFYIQGVLDSWEFRDLSMRNVERGVELSTEGQANHYIALCLRAREMKLGQITAIVQNYITDNLNEWHRPMVLIVYSVLANACIKGLKAP